MNDNKNKIKSGKDQKEEQHNGADENDSLLKNPFDPNDKKQIDQQSLDNEQQFKEALTERD